MSRLARLVRTVATLGRVASIGGRTVLSLDTNPVPADWTHITKVDPEAGKEVPLAYPLYLSHTSAVSVGGSQDVTERNTEETFNLINAAEVSAFHEPSAAAHVTDRTREVADFMAVPEVLNGDSEALVGRLGRGIEHVRETLAPDLIAGALPLPVGGRLGDRLSEFAAAWMLEEAVFEAYVIMNLDSAAAREANVTEADLLSPAAARQRAMAAETHLDSEIVYLEYSGRFGGEEAVELLEAIDGGVSWSRLWYGGGLDDRENTRAVLDAGADAVVVGNVFHEIAGEEADLYRAAREAFDGDVPDREAVREFVEDRIDPAGTAAAGYLSTVVSVPEPADRAVRYLAAGVHTGLELRALADGLEDPDAADVRAAAASSPGAAHLADAVEDADGLAERLAVALLAEGAGVEVEGALPAGHLGLSL